MKGDPTEADLEHARELARQRPPLSEEGIANMRRLFADAIDLQLRAKRARRDAA